MGEDEFEDALARAVHGEVMVDPRPSPALLEALLRVAAARTPGERRPRIRAARRVHEQEEGAEGSGVDEEGVDEDDVLPEAPEETAGDLPPLEDLPEQDRPQHASLRGELLLDDLLPRWSDDEEPPRPRA